MFFSIIDHLSGYFQMALEEDNQNLTTVITLLSLYKSKTLAMGLASARDFFSKPIGVNFCRLL